MKYRNDSHLDRIDMQRLLADPVDQAQRDALDSARKVFPFATDLRYWPGGSEQGLMGERVLFSFPGGQFDAVWSPGRRQIEIAVDDADSWDRLADQVDFF